MLSNHAILGRSLGSDKVRKVPNKVMQKAYNICDMD